MSQWIAIRRKAAQLLSQYETKAQAKGLPPAFSSDSGPYAVLPLIARHCLRLSMLEDIGLEEGVVGCINREDDTISIKSGLKPSKRNFVIAHEIGHDVLGHPPRLFVEDAAGVSVAPLPSSTEQVPPNESNKLIASDKEEDINEEPNVAILLPGDGALRRYSTRSSVELQANVFAAELLAPLEKVREWVEQHIPLDLDKMVAYFGLSKKALKNQLMAAYCNAGAFQEEEVRILPEMDESQYTAATATASALIVAGPGAGKTRVLIARFIHLIEEKNVPPSQILALTYSNKAAEEMRLRLCSALSPDIEHEITVGTFHSFSQQLLIEYWREIGFTHEPKLVTDADAFILLRSHLAELPLNSFADIFEPSRNLPIILDAIARLKEELIGPEEFRCQVEEWAATAKPIQNKQVQKARDLATIYEHYQGWLIRDSLVDYGDLIMRAVGIFENDVLAWVLRDRFTQVLVDEFQDVSRASGRLIQLLDGNRGVSWVVADPRQSIYGFRGASRANVEQFLIDFEDSQILELSTNYRSVEDVVYAGNSVNFGTVSDNPDPLQPELIAHYPRAATPAITAALAPNIESEIAGVTQTVERLRKEGYEPKQIGILCRRREMAQQISSALESAGIPTDWSGAMHEQSAFKDMMAILLLACNHSHALSRLVRHSAHQLTEQDANVVLSTLVSKGGSPRSALRAIVKGNVEGVSSAGLNALTKLREIAVRGGKRPNAFNVLTAYLWEETDWFLNMCRDNSPSAQRYIATVGQVVDLAREFDSKNSLYSRTKTADFVDYIRSCIETKKLKTSHIPIPIPGSVTITTIHGSKGLEWPVVLTPGWVQKSPPPSKISWPPKMATSLLEANDLRTRACLAYVAVTRAREKLFISRVDDEKSLPEQAFSDLVQALESENLLENASWPDIAVGDISNSEDDDCSIAEITDKSSEGELLEIEIDILEDLQFCEQKAKYVHLDGLRSESTGYMLFRRILNQTFGWMIELKKSDGIPDYDEIENYLSKLWEKATPHERQLEEFYTVRAREYAHIFSERLKRSGQVRWKVGFENSWAVPGVRLKFCADECEDGKKPILRWHSFSSPSDKKLRAKLCLALYSRRKIRGVIPEIRIYHVSTGTEEVIKFGPDDWLEAKKELIRLYGTWQRGTSFVPKNSYECLFCSFNLICPS